MAAAELFSKVSRRIWLDDKFCELSMPAPNAQTIWLYLLTGKHNGAIPGVFVLGELALAEDLGWDPEPTRRCLQEILERGMARFDRRRRLFWLPNAIAHNLPRSPKQVLGWAQAWKLLPECDLLREAAVAIRAVLAAKSQKFADAFDKVVSGQVDLVDAGDDGDDGAPPSSNRTFAGSKQKSLSDRDADLYPIENATPMPFQEKEKEKEIDPPLGGGTRARAREAPPEVAVDDRRTGETAGQHPGGAPVAERDLLPVEAQVLAALRERPAGLHPMSPAPLARAATPDVARYLAAQAAPGGRLELSDVVNAIRQAAEEETGRIAARGPSDVDRLHGLVRGYVRKARRGEGRQAEASSGRGGSGAGPLSDHETQAMALWESLWSAEHNGATHPTTDLDRVEIRKLVVRAGERARAVGATKVSDVLRHYLAGYLRLDDKKLVDERYPLSLLMHRLKAIGEYEPPKSKQTVVSAPVAKPTPAEEAAALQQARDGAKAVRDSLASAPAFDIRGTRPMAVTAS